jgi:hypothetical protein
MTTEYDRRRFLSDTGKALLAATIVNGLGVTETNAAGIPQDGTDETAPVEFSSIKDASEKPDAIIVAISTKGLRSAPIAHFRMAGSNLR